MESQTADDLPDVIIPEPKLRWLRWILFLPVVIVVYLISTGPIILLLEKIPRKYEIGQVYFFPLAISHRLSWEGQIREYNRVHSPEVIGTDRELKIQTGHYYQKPVWLKGLVWYWGLFSDRGENLFLSHCEHATTPGLYYD